VGLKLTERVNARLPRRILVFVKFRPCNLNATYKASAPAIAAPWAKFIFIRDGNHIKNRELIQNFCSLEPGESFQTRVREISKEIVLKSIRAASDEKRVKGLKKYPHTGPLKNLLPKGAKSIR
jgi:hypothetical protein